MIRFYWWCIANACYYIGDAFSRLDIFFQDWEWFCRLWYKPYSYFMLKSYSIDQKHDFGIWIDGSRLP